MKATSGRDTVRNAGFTLLELVAAITLFALIIVYVLADREDSLRLSADAKIVQTVHYLAAAKIDEIRHDPESFGDSDGGDFSELENDWQKFPEFSWELSVDRVAVIGKTEEKQDSYLFDTDEDADAPTDEAGKELPTRYVRRATLTVRFQPDGEERSDLDVVIKTYLPPLKDDEPTAETGQ